MTHIRDVRPPAQKGLRQPVERPRPDVLRPAGCACLWMADHPFGRQCGTFTGGVQRAAAVEFATTEDGDGTGFGERIAGDARLFGEIVSLMRYCHNSVRLVLMLPLATSPH